MKMTDIILNLLIFLVTFVLVLRFPWKDGQWLPDRWKKAFRYFTVQSNVLCAASCLLSAIFGIGGEIPEKIWLLKYIGTAAVTVTMLTVFLFLAPSIGKDGLKVLLGSVSDFFMHLVTPVAAIVSFCLLEKRGMSFPVTLLGMLPVVLYGIQYIRRTQFGPAEKRWEDFYGFNRNGKMVYSAIGMLIGTFLICMGLMALQNAAG